MWKRNQRCSVSKAVGWSDQANEWPYQRLTTKPLDTIPSSSTTAGTHQEPRCCQPARRYAFVHAPQEQKKARENQSRLLLCTVKSTARLLTRRLLPMLSMLLMLLPVSRRLVVRRVLLPVSRRLADRKLSTSSEWLPSSSGCRSITPTRLSARRTSSSAAAWRLFERREGSRLSLPPLCICNPSPPSPPLPLPLDEVDDVL